MISEINVKVPTDQLYALLHAMDTRSGAGLDLDVQRAGGGSLTEVADFQGEVGVAVYAYFGLMISGMAMNVGEALLHNAEQGQFHITGHAPEKR